MPRRLLVRLFIRLQASPLPVLDPVRQELARELDELMAPATVREGRRVIVIHADARSDVETLPN